MASVGGAPTCMASSSSVGNFVEQNAGVLPAWTRTRRGCSNLRGVRIRCAGASPAQSFPVREPGAAAEDAASGALGLCRGVSRGVLCRSAAPTASAKIPASSSEAFALSEEQKAQFEDQGFLVLPGFASHEECERLQTRMAQLVDDFDPSTVSVFSTRDQVKLTNDYFLRSGRNISFFFEENAFDEQGGLKQPKALSVNKVGHALHDLDPEFRAFSRSLKMAALARSLGFHQHIPVQSMYIFKQPGIGGEVVPHQDSSFVYTQPMSCIGLWLAVEDATEENGCLWALPGSHKDGLKRRFVRTIEGGVKFDKAESPVYDVSQFTPLPASQGSLVVLHGLLVHFSYENKSPISRHAYAVHFIEGGSVYPEDNWLQRGPEDPPFEPLSE